MTTTLKTPGNGKTDSILTQGDFLFHTATENGIVFKTDCPRDHWLDVVQRLTEMHESSGRLHFRSICILADALNFGESAYGEEYAQAIDETRKWMQVSSKTIHNAMWVMKHIPASRRRELLTLSHHEQVAALPPDEQDELLGQAEEGNMTVAELKKLVMARHPKTKRGADRSSKNGKDKPEALTINNATEAKHAATLLSNWLTANEEKINDTWKPLLEHFHKLFRRRWQNGKARR